MAISSRGEMGVGGGSRGGSVGGGVARRRANSAAAAKVVKPKAKAQSKSVKVTAKSSMEDRVLKNINTQNTVEDMKSGSLAYHSARAVNTGKPKTTVKINSGNTTRTPSKPAKVKTYWQLKGLPSLVKINSGTGNKTVPPITYRRKAAKATPAKKATGRRGQ